MLVGGEWFITISDKRIQHHAGTVAGVLQSNLHLMLTCIQIVLPEQVESPFDEIGWPLRCFYQLAIYMQFGSKDVVFLGVGLR